MSNILLSPITLHIKEIFPSIRAVNVDCHNTNVKVQSLGDEWRNIFEIENLSNRSRSLILELFIFNSWLIVNKSENNSDLLTNLTLPGSYKEASEQKRCQPTLSLRLKIFGMRKMKLCPLVGNLKATSLLVCCFSARMEESSTRDCLATSTSSRQASLQQIFLRWQNFSSMKTGRPVQRFFGPLSIYWADCNCKKL